MRVTSLTLAITLALTLSWLPGAWSSVTAQINSHWPGGFNGNLGLVAKDNHEGFHIVLVFNVAVESLDVWNEAVQKVSDHEFLLTNLDYNSHVTAGSQLTLGFNGHTGGQDLTPTVCAYIVGEEPDSVCPRPGGVTPAVTTGTPSVTTASTPTPAGVTTTVTPAPTSTPMVITSTTASPTTTTPLPTTTTPLPTTTTPLPTTTTPAPTTTTPIPTTTTTPIPTTTLPLQDMKNFSEALRLSQQFYYAQRSGKLPADNPISWRYDSALGDCIVGGWYDAGDHVKFTYPMAGMLTILLWGGDRFAKGYQVADQMDTFYDTVRWGLDWLLDAWDPFKEELVVQVGDADRDHRYWGRPENMTMLRPCTVLSPDKPGSDVAGDVAAALAAGAVVFRSKGDTRYAVELLAAAQSVYRFAREHRGIFSHNPLPSDWLSTGWSYASDGDKDELCQAAVWLFRATADLEYLEQAKTFYEDTIANGGYNWDDKRAGCQLLLYEATLDQRYKQNVEDFLNIWINAVGERQYYTPCGLAWGNNTDWGSARHVSNVAFIALMAADDDVDAVKNRKWAAEQINYLLGDNPHDGGCFSYEIGYGEKYPLRPHHRAASCPDLPAPCDFSNLNSTSDPSPHILYGGLVGGPILDDTYNDTREDYVHNEVALDYNAGFQSAVAGLNKLVAEGHFPTTENRCPCQRRDVTGAVVTAYVTPTPDVMTIATAAPSRITPSGATTPDVMTTAVVTDAVTPSPDVMTTVVVTDYVTSSSDVMTTVTAAPSQGSSSHTHPTHTTHHTHTTNPTL